MDWQIIAILVLLTLLLSAFAADMPKPGGSQATDTSPQIFMDPEPDTPEQAAAKRDELAAYMQRFIEPEDQTPADEPPPSEASQPSRATQIRANFTHVHRIEFSLA